jgi:fibronectin-binding autotransporter adhesin
MNLTITMKRAALVAAIVTGLAGTLSAGTFNNYTGSTTGSVLTAGNWSLGTVPTIFNDAVFITTPGTGIRTMNTGNMTVNSLNVTATANTYTIRQDTTSTTRILTLGGLGSSSNSVSGTATDLLFAASGSTLNLSNGTGSNAVLNLALGQSGTFNIVGTSTISALISGTGFGFTKTGAGTLTLSSANSTYSGGTAINTGRLVVANSSTGTPPTLTNGPAGTGTLTLNGGTLANSGNRTLGNAISLAAVTNTVDTPSSSLTLSGVISGGAGNTLVKTGSTSGTSTLVLSGDNDYAGQTLLEASSSTGRNELRITHANALGTTAGNTEVRTSGTTNGSRLELLGNFVTNEQVAIGGLNTAPESITFRLVGDTAAGANEISGDITTIGGVGTNYSIRADGIAGFTISGDVRETSGSNSTLVLGNGDATGVGVISGDIKEDSSGSTWNVFKRDAGTWTFSGANTYVGTTTVNAGTLLVNGANSGGGTYTAATGGTLGGTGSVGSSAVAVQSGGTLAPGASSIDTFSVGSADIDGTLAIEYNGGTIDKLLVAGALDIAGATLTFSNLGALTSGAHVLAQYGSLTGNPFTTVNGLPSGYGIKYDYQSNKIALVPILPGDFNADGDVDGDDFATWQMNFPTASGATLAQGDADGDGDVDGADFVAWQTNFPFAPSAEASPVAEPAGSILIIFAAVAMVGLMLGRSYRRKLATVPVYRR